MSTPERSPEAPCQQITTGPAKDAVGSAISQSTLDSLAFAIGREGLKQVIGELQAEAPTMVAGLLAAAQTADARAMRHFAHMMKSNAKLLGAEALSGHCGQVEQLAMAGESELAAALASTAAVQFEVMVSTLIQLQT